LKYKAEEEADKDEKNLSANVEKKILKCSKINCCFYK